MQEYTLNIITSNTHIVSDQIYLIDCKAYHMLTILTFFHGFTQAMGLTASIFLSPKACSMTIL